MAAKTIIPATKASPPSQSDQPDLSHLRLQADTPIAFGISLHPELSVAVFAVLGISGGIYLSLNQLMPAWSNHQKLAADLV